MNADGYELFFNRDELRTRKPAQPPTVRECNGVKFIAPTDGDFGGSWIGVNEFGVAVGLLNWYEPGANPRTVLPPAVGYRSRGLLLISLMDCQSPDDIARVLGGNKLTDYPPFLLLTLAPKLKPRLHKWDGGRLADQSEPSPPVSTSPFDAVAVLRARQVRFAELTRSGVNSTVLQRYHESHDPKGDAYSVCMSRPDAQTMSYSRVRVTPAKIEFQYSPRLPGNGSFAPPAMVSCLRRGMPTGDRPLSDD